MAPPTPHLSAHAGDIAESVLMPGDPLRAKWIAETYLSDLHCYNEVRGMFGFTGTYQGVRVSVQGHGMGAPSIGIYATELFKFYGVTTAIRVGSCGALLDAVALRDVVVAASAHTDSSFVQQTMGIVHYAPTATYSLVRRADDEATKRGLRVHIGPVHTSDRFYDTDPAVFDLLTAHGTLGVEMESAALYAVAAAHGVKAVSLLTVSDHLRSHETLSSQERQLGLAAMTELALAMVVAA